MSVDVGKKLERAISRLPRVDSFEFNSRLYPEFTAEHALNGVFGASVLLALHRAREAQELAVSYRDFKVGAAVLYFTFKPAKMQIVSGINIKPQEDSAINIHAEQLALQKMNDRNGDIISLIAVVGDVQPDTQSGRLAKTLHPCGLCREALLASGVVDDDRTLVVGALPDLRTIEMYPFGALTDFHQHNDYTRIFPVNLPELELLKPYEVADPTVPVVLSETAESNAEEDIWEESVELPLLSFRLTGHWPSSS